MRDDLRRLSSRAFRLVVVPALIYLVVLVAMTWPAALHFDTHFYCDAGDGLQNVWNLWWFDHAVTAGESPYFTKMLHAPSGVDLIGQTMVPINGLSGMVLLRFFSLVVTHNLLFIFAFVGSGVSAFWLSYYVGRNTGGALVCGGIYTFSSYHFAHAEGHMQLVAMEFIPLFILSFWWMLEQPTIWRGLVAAGALYLVRLCDLYYLMFCVIAAGSLVVCAASRASDWRVVLRRPLVGALASFGLVAILTSGVVVVRLVIADRADPLMGGHSAYEFAMDLMSPFVPGGHWVMGSLTKWLWEHWKGNIHESSVYLGWVGLGLAIFAWARRKDIGSALVMPWYGMFWVFFVLALGPRLRVGGAAVPVPLPYGLISWLPGFRLSGMPVRFVVMCVLSLAVAAGLGWRELDRLRAGSRMLVRALLLVVMAVEFWPRAIPLSPTEVPEYVLAVRNLPTGAVIDSVGGPGQMLYYQTVHGHPLAFGYVTREPRSVQIQDRRFRDWLEAGEWRMLGGEGIRYVVLAMAVEDENLELEWSGSGAWVYQIRGGVEGTTGGIGAAGN